MPSSEVIFAGLRAYYLRNPGQTAERMAGGMPAGSRRTVSLHDPHARVIVKGRLGKPVEFGYKAQLVDNEER
jgi:IS5 family transposase